MFQSEHSNLFIFIRPWFSLYAHLVIIFGNILHLFFYYLYYLYFFAPSHNESVYNDTQPAQQQLSWKIITTNKMIKINRERIEMCLYANSFLKGAWTQRKRMQLLSSKINSKSLWNMTLANHEVVILISDVKIFTQRCVWALYTKEILWIQSS